MTGSDALRAQVREEIEDLHQFFVDWFSGHASVDTFPDRFTARFDAALVLIPPGGNFLRLPDLSSGIKNAHGSNADFRIAIRNVQVHRVTGNDVLATYEEWQRNAKASSPPDNGRRATVLFRADGDISSPSRLIWVHVHETWLPEEVMKKGPFDF